MLFLIMSTLLFPCKDDNLTIWPMVFGGNKVPYKASTVWNSERLSLFYLFVSKFMDFLLKTIIIINIWEHMDTRRSLKTCCIDSIFEQTVVVLYWKQVSHLLLLNQYYIIWGAKMAQWCRPMWPSDIFGLSLLLVPTLLQGFFFFRVQFFSFQENQHLQISIWPG